jgi:hypothetical protein
MVRSLDPLPFVTCGDDMAAVWSKGKTDAYFCNLESVGLVVNREKSFRSPDALVFVEKLFYQKRVDQPAIPAGRLVFSALTRAKASRTSAPSWATLGQVINDCLTQAAGKRWLRLAIWDTARTLHPEAFSVWEKSGRPVHWPKSLGGWGILNPEDPSKLVAPPNVRKAAAIAITSGRPQLLAHKEETPMPKVFKDIIQMVHDHSHPQERAGENAMPLDDVVEVLHSKLGSLVRGDPFLAASDRRYRAPKGREFRKVVRELTGRWLSVKPLSDKAALSYEEKLYISLPILSVVLAKKAGIPPTFLRDEITRNSVFVPCEQVQRRMSLMDSIANRPPRRHVDAAARYPRTFADWDICRITSHHTQDSSSGNNPRVCDRCGKIRRNEAEL